MMATGQLYHSKGTIEWSPVQHVDLPGIPLNTQSPPDIEEIQVPPGASSTPLNQSTQSMDMFSKPSPPPPSQAPKPEERVSEEEEFPDHNLEVIETWGFEEDSDHAVDVPRRLLHQAVREADGARNGMKSEHEDLHPLWSPVLHRAEGNDDTMYMFFTRSTAACHGPGGDVFMTSYDLATAAWGAPRKILSYQVHKIVYQPFLKYV